MTQTVVEPAATDDPLADTEPAQTHAAGSAQRITTPGQLWQQVRKPALFIAVVLLLVLLAALFTERARQGELDPDAADPRGSRALAQLLENRGVDVRRVRGLPEELSGTVFVPFAKLLSEREVDALTDTPTGDVVLVGITPDRVLGLTVEEEGDAAPRTVAPRCDLPLAVAAGEADIGGLRFAPQAGAADARVFSCYAVEGRPSLLRVERDDESVTMLGSARAFTNDLLDEEGNAALALGLLDQGAPVTWVMPPPAGTADPDEQKSLAELLPGRVFLVLLQLIFAVIIAMLWRGRRLGPVVTERLPVVVRAAEAVEGRGRLYAAAKARGGAAAQLRAGARARLRTRLGTTPDARGDVLIEGVATHTGREPEAVKTLLYGPDPVDDPALTKLADDLDSLDSEVRRS